MKNKNIYVVLPAYFKTGGTELGHQLVWLLNNEKVNAKIAYIDTKKYDNPLNPEFEKYKTSWIDFNDIEDDDNNVIIFPEVYTELVLKFKTSKKIIWWMSVDNYTQNVSVKSLYKIVGFLRTIKAILVGHFKSSKLKKEGIFCADLHLYQSEYARLYLIKNGFNNLMPLSDFINDSYFLNSVTFEKEDIVLYNPKKGIKFTKKIIARNSDLKWIAIEKMSTEEVVELLGRSKVYIDFGNHPGKDRFPREAAIKGCCIITGKRGAAQNNIDIPISPAYKFKDNNSQIKLISKKIRECLLNYDACIKDFNSYREKITKEKDIFYQDTKDLLIKFVSTLE